MQTSKARDNNSEVPLRKSPASPRPARKLKIPNSDSDLVSSRSPARKTPKDRSPKVIERRSSQSPISEKKRPSKVQELESQIAHLQEELKSAKDELNSSESWKREAQQEAEEAKARLSAMSKELEKSHQQLSELSASEKARLQELRVISQDRDRAWQSELEAIEKQHSMDSAALASAMNEIEKLKTQLEQVCECKATQTNNVESAHTEIQNLRMELGEALCMEEKLKNEASDCKESESRALEVVGRMKMQLETTNKTVETLRSDGVKAMEAYKSLALELEQSRTQAKSLEELVSKLQADLVSSADKSILGPTSEKEPSQENGENEEINKLKAELISAKSELEQLKSALDVAVVRYHEEYIQSTLQFGSAYEELERTKSESGQIEVELYEELRRAKADTEELKASLMEKESHLLSISDENKVLNSRLKENQCAEREPEIVKELRKLEADIAELKEKLLDREKDVQNMTAENSMLKIEVKERLEKNRTTDEAIASAESARAAEKEALTKLEHIIEEVDKSNRSVARVTEQLDAAHDANSELETELRRLKVQSEQWRKAAEAAASVLSTGNNGKVVGKKCSRDSSFNSITGKMNSPCNLEDTNYDSPKKKNTNNVLKKIGVLWKKNHQ